MTSTGGSLHSSSTNGWKGAFDGNLDISPNSNATAWINGFATLELPQEYDGDFVIYGRYISSTTNDSSSKVELLDAQDNVLATASINAVAQNAAVAPYDLGTLTGVKKIRTGSNSVHAPIIYGVELNGKVLIDGCARWNTSQTWSDRWTNPIIDLTNTFNGNLTDYGGISKTTHGDNYSSRVEFNPTLSGRLRVNGSNQSAEGTARLGCQISLSDGQIYDVSSVHSTTPIGEKMV